jgi:predicted unusual protein kinase regulating ubiquinone biosynthesis (AarF/ABC1/UbiB family)
VAVKVQRPGVLSTISLDLFILRCLTMAINKLPNQKGSIDFLMLFDHWAAHLFQELDYTLEVAFLAPFFLSLTNNLLNLDRF